MTRFKTPMWAVLFVALGSSPLQAQDQQIDFAHDVLPILKSKCASCHTNGIYKGGLSLESKEQLLDSGAVEPGDHESSDLYDRLISDDEDYVMPPPDEGKSLTKEEIRKVAAWIDADLPWPVEISLKKPVFRRELALAKVNLPRVLAPNENPVDAFVEKYLDDMSVPQPAPISDREFIRRAKMDLVGLLPTPREAHAFVSQRNTKKHESLVSDLLAREREYADHWMSFWNDLLRNDYAGTGYIDGGREQITTWLHSSLVENKPYDVMVRELVNPSKASRGFIKGIKWRGRVNAS